MKINFINRSDLYSIHYSKCRSLFMPDLACALLLHCDLWMKKLQVIKKKFERNLGRNDYTQPIKMYRDKCVDQNITQIHCKDAMTSALCRT